MSTPRIHPEDWKDPRHRAGWDGEVVAGEWLIARGWTIEAHRWKSGKHDVDLIARRGTLVAFIEVKVRRTNVCGTGTEAIVASKRRHIERCAWSWLLKCGRASDLYRFDVITLEGSGPGGVELTHLEDAWRPGWR